ncbi:Exodeoxyribonuclease VII large subunit [Desulfocicer vacuolatum DSM 3385]|uniref:Exodeoxyribonuclease 7 large subunit n=1 Tax=Desulfocicer vacuolatum DSM 3385 TaxID=1121400 RepID=A0A1W2AIK1_9BACT|nr:exodeoxyribonuclease VII large subunit [Desulfocicer vacuolatum]SMC60507.1 Exodeoxyribonuclease VII large subunit [Desulfocicer vacuolatum DSM 3385]
MNSKNSPQIYTVSGLTRQLKQLIESTYPFVWLTGEISNLSRPASGHCYFSLKDDGALINGVMFRNQLKRMPFNPENGMRITGMGRLSLYEPRGNYQIIFEHMAPDGAGLLHAKFELLKKQLAAEGLFDKSHKSTLPFLPLKISIITSPTGAVVRDIIQVSQRRFSGIHLEVVPVKVQGDGAETDIEQAIETVNKCATSQVIIVARGGGSLEDLAAFNSERVARAVFASSIPVVSAVGHETDFTICDFVSDLRAPTPSAAAELVLPERKKLHRDIITYENALETALKRGLKHLKTQVKTLNSRLKNPRSRVDDLRMRLEDLEKRLTGRMQGQLKAHGERLSWYTNALYAASPLRRVSEQKETCRFLHRQLVQSMVSTLTSARSKIHENHSKLGALSPLAVLHRGYSITRTRDSKQKIITDSTTTKNGDSVEVLLSKGRLICQVEKQYAQKENI